MRTVRLLAPLTAIVLLAVGCGSESGSDSGSDSGTGADAGSTSDPGAGESSGTALEITFWPGGESQGSPQSWTLRCDPPDGTHTRPDEACRRLAAFDDPFAPPPAGQICTEQYGGPEEALVSGSYRGEPVSAPLSRTNGCEIDRFERLGFLLPGSGRA